MALPPQGVVASLQLDVTLEEIRTSFLDRLDLIITRHYWINPSPDQPNPTEEDVRGAIERVVGSMPWYWQIGNLTETEGAGRPNTDGGSN